jgi:adenosine deaminase
MKISGLPQRPAEFYRALPKVDLHRHLEGSLRFETLRGLARLHGLDLPPTARLKTMVQIQEDEPLNFENFLSKFTTLRLFYRSPEIIRRITYEAVADAAADNVRYLELRFTPVALSKAQGFPLARVMDWVIEGAQQGEQEHGVITRLIASINRHESVALAAQVSYLAIERRAAGIVGLDLAGNEADFPAAPFKEIFLMAKKRDLGVTIHAGEWGAGENVAHAFQALSADRIGHGIRVLDSPAALDAARRARIPFEVCLTSNYQSGAAPATQPHPVVRMFGQDLNITLNSDDPSISQITLSDEYRLACEVLEIPLDRLKQCIFASARAAFLPPAEREALVNKLKGELSAKQFQQ